MRGELDWCRTCHEQGSPLTAGSQFVLGEDVGEDEARMLQAYELFGADLLAIPAELNGQQHGSGPVITKEQELQKWTAFLDVLADPQGVCGGT